MINLLLKRIQELENRLDEISKNNQQTKNEILELFKQCKVDKNLKENFKKRLIDIIDKLNIANNEKYFNENYLKYTTFIDIAKSLKNGYLVIVDANFNDDIKKFILGFLLNKISPFFTLDKNLIIGIIDEKQYQEIKSINTISYYNPKSNDFSEIELKKIVFETENFDYLTIEKAKKIFNEFQKRPSYKNKHYIEYSLIKNKITDFEKDKLDKQKEKYAYIYDETYPNLEFKLKKEIKNIPFVLALLERIDKELDEIKQSKGIINVVNRILNYIEMNIVELRDEIKILRDKLKEDDYR